MIPRLTAILWKFSAPKLLRVSDVAERMAASKATVYRRIAEGALPAVRIGLGTNAHLRVAEDELTTFLYADPPAKETQ